MTKTLENCACGNCTPTPKGKRVTVAQAVAAVNAVCKQLENVTVAEQADPFQGREVVGLYAAVNQDGTDAGVLKAIRVGDREERQRYAEPVPYYETENENRRGTGGDVSGPAAQDELERKQAKAKAVQAVIDAPGTSDQERAAARSELIKLLEDIQALTLALHPTPKVGKSPSTGA